MTPAQNSCVIEVGGIPISVHTGDQGFLHILCQRYAGFLSDSPPQVELTLDLTLSAPVTDDDVTVHRTASGWILERGDFHATWDPHSGKGRVRQASNPYALDSVLRIVHSVILASRGGFLLHAASAIAPSIESASGTRSLAYLFSGVSGAGKTTLTRLAPPAVTLLTDEISYVRRGADGYCAYGTPFSGELAKAGENTAAPISALFFLEKGSRNETTELSSSEAVRRLMRNILFFAEDRELVEKLLATACDFVQRVPVRVLSFFPDSRVWDAILHFEAESIHA